MSHDALSTAAINAVDVYADDEMRWRRWESHGNNTSRTELSDLHPADRFSRAPLFPNPRTGRMWPHKALQSVWSKALGAADMPRVSLYEGTKHSMATDAIRRGVSERALPRFLGHASVPSTRRDARLADNALIEVLRPARSGWRQAGDKGSENEAERSHEVARGPSRIRTWARPVMSRLL